VSKVLIIEDDRSLVDVLAYNLRQAGYEVSTAFDGMDGLSQAQLRVPDMIVLDLMLPVMDGLEVCRRIRSDPHTSSILVLMLTARVEEADQLVGFSVGADDYVTKPFSIRVLMQRIKALERRRRPASNGDPDVVSLSDVTVDRRRHQAVVAGRTLNLTRSEFRLLDTMIRQAGRAFSRSELISAALGDDAIVLERTIDVHIRAVRRKLEDQADVIQTVRGVGYRFRDPNSPDDDPHTAE
jgi:two-component system phosphate regulon response regulator PhoB